MEQTIQEQEEALANAKRWEAAVNRLVFAADAVEAFGVTVKIKIIQEEKK